MIQSLKPIHLPYTHDGQNTHYYYKVHMQEYGILIMQHMLEKK